MELGAFSCIPSSDPLQNPLNSWCKEHQKPPDPKMDLWEQGKFVALVNNCHNEAHMWTSSLKHQTFKVKARRFNTSVLERRLRSVACIKACDGGSLLYLEESCTKIVPKLWGQSWRQNVPTFVSQTLWTLNAFVLNHIQSSPRPSWSILPWKGWWRWLPISQVEQGPVALME